MPENTLQTPPQIIIDGGSAPQPAPGPGLRMLVLSGLVVVAAMVAGLTAWSVLAPLQSAAVAPGSVSVEFNRKTIKHLEGGIVRRILVAEGETVRAGQLLIELDTTQARAQLELLRGRRAAATARYARLAAERDRHDRIRIPEWLDNQRSETQIADIIAQSNDVDPGPGKFARNIARAFREPVEQPVGDAVAVDEILEEVIHAADIP